jgi:DNA modification methylase
VPDGGLVIDPFSGSGTTVAAAIKAKRNIRFLGCDIDTSQVELTKRRIKEASQHELV